MGELAGRAAEALNVPVAALQWEGMTEAMDSSKTLASYGIEAGCVMALSPGEDDYDEDNEDYEDAAYMEGEKECEETETLAGRKRKHDFEEGSGATTGGASGSASGHAPEGTVSGTKQPSAGAAARAARRATISYDVLYHKKRFLEILRLPKGVPDMPSDETASKELRRVMAALQGIGKDDRADIAAGIFAYNDTMYPKEETYLELVDEALRAIRKAQGAGHQGHYSILIQAAATGKLGAELHAAIGSAGLKDVIVVQADLIPNSSLGIVGVNDNNAPLMPSGEPYRSGSFDLVMARNCWYNVTSAWQLLLKGCAEMLAPGGSLSVGLTLPMMHALGPSLIAALGSEVLVGGNVVVKKKLCPDTDRGPTVYIWSARRGEALSSAATSWWSTQGKTREYLPESAFDDGAHIFAACVGGKSSAGAAEGGCSAAEGGAGSSSSSSGTTTHFSSTNSLGTDGPMIFARSSAESFDMAAEAGRLREVVGIRRNYHQSLAFCSGAESAALFALCYDPAQREELARLMPEAVRNNISPLLVMSFNALLNSGIDSAAAMVDLQERRNREVNSIKDGGEGSSSSSSSSASSSAGGSAGGSAGSATSRAKTLIAALSKAPSTIAELHGRAAPNTDPLDHGHSMGAYVLIHPTEGKPAGLGPIGRMMTQLLRVNGRTIEGRMIAIFPNIYGGPAEGGDRIHVNPLLRTVCEGVECIYSNLGGGLAVGRTMYCSPTTTNTYRGFGGSLGSGAVDKAAAAALDALGEAGRKEVLDKHKQAFQDAHQLWKADGMRGNLLDKAPTGTREVWRILVKMENGDAAARMLKEGAAALAPAQQVAFAAVGGGGAMTEAERRRAAMRKRHQGE